MRKEVYIVGGGSSLLGFNFELLKDKDTIVVNKSILNVPNSKYFITVDYTFLRKINFENIQNNQATKIFIACLHFEYMREEDGRIFDARNGRVYDLSDFDVVIKSRKIDGFGYEFKDFSNGLNSGYCALQLAVILGYEKIYLLGFDLTLDPTNYKTHYHEGYSQNEEKFNHNLSVYLNYFIDSLEQIKKETSIKVYSCSKISKLNKYIKYREFVQ